MDDLGEAAGTVIEGGLIGRAVSVEKRKPGVDAGVRADGHFAEDTCLNCGTVLTGRHCHHCGQKAHLHRTIGAFMHDMLHGALHFDGKTWRTLPKLVLRPGELTRRYIDGERARFVSPMALFLFSVFLMFAVFQAIGLTPPTDIQTRDGISAQLGEVRKGLIAERDSFRSASRRLQPLRPSALPHRANWPRPRSGWRRSRGLEKRWQARADCHRSR